ncbi:MAG: preprotein translocase subunit SecG [Proteobacteria bacterium]|nr:preprotein translocase subunit SecG [Pseudomonadota bacterium]
MENLQLFLLVLQVVIALVMIILVLMQKSDGDSLSGIGGGSGGMNSAISSKATANALSKITMILAGIFMINCLVLASLSNAPNNAVKKDLEAIIEQQENNPESTTKKAPSVPPVQ